MKLTIEVTEQAVNNFHTFIASHRKTLTDEEYEDLSDLDLILIVALRNEKERLAHVGSQENSPSWL